MTAAASGSRLIEDIDFAALIAEKPFDYDRLRATLNERSALAVIEAQEFQQYHHVRRV